MQILNLFQIGHIWSFAIISQVVSPQGLKGLGQPILEILILFNSGDFELQTSNWQCKSLSFAKSRPHKNREHDYPAV